MNYKLQTLSYPILSTFEQAFLSRVRGLIGGRIGNVSNGSQGEIAALVMFPPGANEVFAKTRKEELVQEQDNRK